MKSIRNLFFANIISSLLLTNCGGYDLITYRHVGTTHLIYNEREKHIKLSNEFTKQKKFVINEAIIFPAFKASGKKVARDTYKFGIAGISNKNKVFKIVLFVILLKKYGLYTLILL